MEKLDNVSQKILENAEKEKDKIIDEAKKKAEEIIRGANNKKKNALKATRKEADREYQKTYDLEITKAKSDITQRLLLTKLNIVEEIIEKAKERLRSLNPDDYKNFLSKGLKDLNISKGSYIIGSNENISSDIIKEAAGNMKLEESKKQPDFDKGVKIISGNAEYNLSPDTLVDTQIDDIKMEIADFLFGKE